MEILKRNVRFPLFVLLLLAKLPLTASTFSSKHKDAIWESLHYQPLLNPTLIDGRPLFVDQIFKRGSKYVLFKKAIRPQDSQQAGKLIPHQKGFYYSSPPTAKDSISLFFYRIPETEARQILWQLQQKNFVHRTPWEILIGAKAWATSPTCHSGPEDALLSFGNELEQKSLQEISWTCAAAVGTGAKNKTTDMLESLNPANITVVDLGDFWDESIKTYETIKELLPQLRPMMNELSDLLSSFHPSLKLNLVCSALGSQVIEAISPGGVAKKLVFLKSKIESLKKMIERIKGLSKLYEKHPHSKTLDEATRRIGACVL